MDRPHAAPDEAPDPEILEAVAEAARLAGSPGGGGASVRFDAPDAARRRARASLLVLGLAATAAAAANLVPPARQDPVDLEADLRWAVGHVAAEVEALRRRTGSLPEPWELRTLGGEAVRYLREGEGYRIVGFRDGVEVSYDGSEPLASWLTASSPTADTLR